MSTSPRATFSRSAAIGLGLVVAILFLGNALTGLVNLPAPVDQMLGGNRDSVVQLSDGARVRPAVDSEVQIGHSSGTPTHDGVALVPVTRPRSTAGATDKKKQTSTVPTADRGAGTTGQGALPTGGSTTPAPSGGSTPAPSTPTTPSKGGSGGGSTPPVATVSRKIKLQVANVSSAGGSNASAGGARMRLTLADAATGGAPQTSSAGVTPAVDLQLGMTAHDLAALVGKSAPRGPMVLKARLDVVDPSGTGAEPQMRVRMQLAGAADETDTPTAVEAGDDGGLSNAVEVSIPVDSSQMFRHGGRRHHGSQHGDGQPVVAPAAEIRLPLATATTDQPKPGTPAPVSSDADLSLPTDNSATDGAPAVQVAVSLETVEPPAPPSDDPKPTPTPEPTPTPTPTPDPTPTPTPTPDPAPEATPTPEATPEPTPAPAAADAPAEDPAPATPQAATTEPAPAAQTAPAAATPAVSDAATPAATADVTPTPTPAP